MQKNPQQQQQQQQQDNKPLNEVDWENEPVFMKQHQQQQQLGDKWLKRKWIPTMKYRVGREFSKFFLYMLFPFAVVLITGQPAIKEYLVMRNKYKNVVKNTEEMNQIKDLQDEEEGEDNTYFELQEKNKKRIARFLKLQRATEQDKLENNQQQQQQQQ
jgi:hypothetical protein